MSAYIIGKKANLARKWISYINSKLNQYGKVGLSIIRFTHRYVFMALVIPVRILVQALS